MAIHQTISGSASWSARDLPSEWIKLLSSRRSKIFVRTLAAFALCALMYLESRFVAGFFALIWVALLAGLRFRRHLANSTVVACLTIAVTVTLCAGIIWRIGRSAVRVVSPEPFVSWQVAQGLQSMGIHPAEKVGIIGNSLDFYWAHLAGVRVIAEIPSEGASQFWTSSPTEQERALDVFARSGADAVITDSTILSNGATNWQRIGTTNYFIHSLPSLERTRSELR